MPLKITNNPQFIFFCIAKSRMKWYVSSATYIHEILIIHLIMFQFPVAAISQTSPIHRPPLIHTQKLCEKKMYIKLTKIFRLWESQSSIQQIFIENLLWPLNIDPKAESQALLQLEHQSTTRHPSVPNECLIYTVRTLLYIPHPHTYLWPPVNLKGASDSPFPKTKLTLFSSQHASHCMSPQKAICPSQNHGNRSALLSPSPHLLQIHPLLHPVDLDLSKLFLPVNLLLPLCQNCHRASHRPPHRGPSNWSPTYYLWSSMHSPPARQIC